MGTAHRRLTRPKEAAAVSLAEEAKAPVEMGWGWAVGATATAEGTEVQTLGAKCFAAELRPP